MMTNSTGKSLNQSLPFYWNFAISTAIEGLQTLVYDFDINREIRHHSRYVGVTPDWVLKIIESLLTEKANLDNPKIADLTKMHDRVNQLIRPAYEAGQHAAERHWNSMNTSEREQIMDVEFHIFRNTALPYMPESFSSTQKNWFIEGFSVTIPEKWTQFIISELAKNPPDE